MKGDKGGFLTAETIMSVSCMAYIWMAEFSGTLLGFDDYVSE